MLLLEKSFKIEVTENDIKIIECALHEYRTNILKESKEKEPDVFKYHVCNKGQLVDLANNTRDLRNTFAGLIGKMYMGIDA